MSESITYVFYGIGADLSLITVWAPIATAVFSLFVAIWALVFSSKQLKLTDRNNRLMTKPHIDELLSIRIDSELTYKLLNNGVGPAIIIESSVFIDGKRIHHQQPLLEALETLFAEETPDLQTYTMHCGQHVSPGMKLKLFSFTHPALSAEDLMKALQGRLKIKVKYSSIYGEEFHFSSDFT